MTYLHLKVIIKVIIKVITNVVINVVIIKVINVIIIRVVVFDNLHFIAMIIILILLNQFIMF